MDIDKPETTTSLSHGGLKSGRFSGREEFTQLVRDSLAAAAREGWPEIILSDATFEDWPLRERLVAESLQAWAKPGRHMVILAARYDEVVRYHPRFVQWRITWGHLLDCRVGRGGAIADFPSAIWSRSWFLHRLDPLGCVGVCGNDRGRQVSLKQTLDERIRESSHGFPSTTVGL